MEAAGYGYLTRGDAGRDDGYLNKNPGRDASRYRSQSAPALTSAPFNR